MKRPWYAFLWTSSTVLCVTAQVGYDRSIDAYVSYCPELDLYSQGATHSDAIFMLQDAIVLYVRHAVRVLRRMK